jgi:predicted ATPase/DNA-binding CsgD family transcriptional regulator
VARPKRRIGNLPVEATSFIGRRRELAEIKRKLASAHVVTLVGPGGVGKTRLAIRAATEIGRSFRDGAWLVELAELRDPALIGGAMAAGLDLRDQSATEPRPLALAHLRDRELLLVVDNCEHLLDGVSAFVSEAVSGAPGLRVMATSREPLTATGEHVVPVPPLEMPLPGSVEPLARLRDNEAVSLFIDRATAAAGSFELTESNREAVVEICRRLDGLPLAIELAAVRTRVLSPDQILERLTDRFELLKAGPRAALPRHQTLRTAIEWSHDLLETQERMLLRQLSVFAGHFTLRDAESVCGATLDSMSSLVDKSLVMKDGASFRLHETMREFAAGKLAEAGEQEAVEGQLIEHYWSECVGAGFRARYRLDEWLPWMELEIDNVRWVLRRCQERRDHGRALDIVTSVSWFWITRATTEGVHWFDQLLSAGAANPTTLAWSYFIRGFLAVLQSEPEAARPFLVESVKSARESEQLVALSNALTMSSIAERMAGDRVAAARFLEQAEQVTAEIDDVAARVGLFQARTFAAFFDGDMDTARGAATEGLRLSRDSGDLYAVGMMTMNLGLGILMDGDAGSESKPLFLEALRVAQTIDDRVAQYGVLDALGCLAARSGDAHRAARLLGASETLRAGVGGNLIGFLAPLVAEARDRTIAKLGASRFEAEFESGKHLRREDALALALEEPAPVSAPTAAGPLGKREADVARLVAEGLSNREIGAKLFISERTVDSHVRSILNKLGFNSRSQIAAWFAASAHR